ncbi:hypothetical protein GCM10022213_17450 [Parerythrobacter jejuensis]
MPQWAQLEVLTRFPASDSRVKEMVSPEISTEADGTEKADTNGAPLSFWQALQWQLHDHTGGLLQT